MQTTTKLITILALVLAVTPFAKAEEGYWRASAIHIVPDKDDPDEATGAMVALGTEIDLTNTANTNQLEFEVGWAKWKNGQNVDIGGTSFTGKPDFTFVPVLLTLRHHIRITKNLSVAIGPSVGASYVRSSGTITDGVTSEHISGNDWVFTYGGGVQIYLAISDTISLTAGYRYLFNDDAAFKVAGGTANVSDLNTHVFELGLHFDWPYSY